MSIWSGPTREEVEQLAADYSLTVDRVRALAHERYPDHEHEAEQLIQRATQNVRNALLLDLKERGCPPEQV